MFERFRGPLEAQKPITPQPEKPAAASIAVEKEGLKNRLQEVIRKINNLEQKETAARLQGKIKLAEAFQSELTKTKKEQEEIFNKLQAPQEKPKSEKVYVGAQFPKLPYEYYQNRSRELAAEAAVLERQAADARRRQDSKAAEMFKARHEKIIEEQRNNLREAAELRELKRQGKA